MPKVDGISYAYTDAGKAAAKKAKKNKKKKKKKKNNKYMDVSYYG